MRPSFIFLLALAISLSHAQDTYEDEAESEPFFNEESDEFQKDEIVRFNEDKALNYGIHKLHDVHIDIEKDHHHHEEKEDKKKEKPKDKHKDRPKDKPKDRPKDKPKDKPKERPKDKDKHKHEKEKEKNEVYIDACDGYKGNLKCILSCTLNGFTTGFCDKKGCKCERRRNYHHHYVPVKHTAPRRIAIAKCTGHHPEKKCISACLSHTPHTSGYCNKDFVCICHAPGYTSHELCSAKKHNHKEKDEYNRYEQHHYNRYSDEEDYEESPEVNRFSYSSEEAIRRRGYKVKRRQEEDKEHTSKDKRINKGHDDHKKNHGEVTNIKKDDNLQKDTIEKPGNKGVRIKGDKRKDVKGNQNIKDNKIEAGGHEKDQNHDKQQSESPIKDINLADVVTDQQDSVTVTTSTTIESEITEPTKDEELDQITLSTINITKGLEDENKNVVKVIDEPM